VPRLMLRFLALRIIEAIAEKHQLAELSIRALKRRIDLPPLLSAKEQAPDVEYVRDRRHPPSRFSLPNLLTIVDEVSGINADVQEI
jgi:hypothetical protein